MKIVRAERIPLNLPFYHRRVARAMHRASTHGERVWVVRLESDNGLVGWGDDLGWDQYWDFGGSPPPRPEVDHLVGCNPAELIHRDELGFAPQVALLDLVARDNGVPVHALLGSQVRDRCPVSWWDIDMPPADWAAEARESCRRGYTSFKMKARPWRDIFAQVEAVAAVVPPDYQFDIDFNGFLLNQARSEVFLAELDSHPNVGMYETPFNLNHDLDGARILRERVVKPLIEHFSDPVWAAECCDGFVVLGGVSAMRRDAALAAAGNKPFWLQLVGTGITTAFAIQLGSVLSHAQLPYITCHELWRSDLLTERLVLTDGYAAVPDGPGLGVEVDEKAIELWRVDEREPTPKRRYREQKRILRVRWPGSGRKKRVWSFSDEVHFQRAFYAGNLPPFERGVELEVIEEERSAAFRNEHARIVARGF